MKKYCFLISGSWGENANRDRLESLANALVDLGHRVVIILDHQNHRPLGSSKNISFYSWPSYRPTKLKDALFLWKIIKLHKPDCMISQFGSVNIMLLIGWMLGVSVRLARYETKSKAIEIDAKLSKYHLQILRLRKRLVFKLATTILANSNAALEDLVKVFRVNDNKVQVFYNYLADPLDQNKLSVKRYPNRIVCVGRFNKNKGQDVLIRALALLPAQLKPEVEFVGSGVFLSECQLLAESLGVLDRCHFIGSVSHDEVLNHFAQAIVSVIPSLDEAFGYVCIESLSVGTPVLGSRVGGIPEIVRDKVDGFLFNAGDPEDLAHKIQLFFNAENNQLEMQANARQRFLSTFEQNKVVKDQVDWLLSKLESNKLA